MVEIKRNMFGERNPNYKNGNRIKGNYPCPSCGKPRVCEKRNSHRNCMKCYNIYRKEKVMKNCKFCNKRFQSKMNSIFCSNKCSFKSREKRIKMLCPQCKREFERRKSFAYQRFCSKKCLYESSWVKVKCSYCNKDIKSTIGRIKNKKDFFCNITCSHLWQSENWKGKNHHNYGKKSPTTTKRNLENNPMNDIKARKKSSAKRRGISLEKWDKFISFEPYPITFNSKFKEGIRERDNKICMLCGIHREKLKIRLAVHHIDYIKENTFEENCCSLCKKCHSLTSANRKSWTKFFQSLLSERYGYKYSENGEIILELKNI